jgi:hypothetical protein
MLRKNSIVLYSFVLLFFYSCCNEHDDNNGIIVSDYKIEGDYEDTYYCLKTPDTACVRDNLTYKTLFVVDTISNNCKRLILPSIDFSQYSLLVNRKWTNGNIYYHRNVTVDSLNKTVTFQISTSSCFCPDKCSRFDLNIVIVPKISSDYKIIYE